MAQFPLEMGRKKKSSNALAVQVDAEGKIKYDAIARQGQGKDKVWPFPNVFHLSLAINNTHHHIVSLWCQGNDLSYQMAEMTMVCQF